MDNIKTSFRIQYSVNTQTEKSGKNSRILYKACPLCRSGAIAALMTADCSQHPLYKPEINPLIEWLRCAACGHVFTSGYFSDAALKIIFGNTNEHQIVGYDIESQRYVSARMIEKILPYKQHGDWLDIGFGNASLLFTAAEYGFTAVGIDLRPDNVQALSNLGFEAYCMDIQAFDHYGRFDVISMADVLEHMPFPTESLNAVRKLLKENGVLFLSMPNSDSMLWQMLNQNDANPYWGELEHYHNFSRTRLYRLLEECGFKPLRYGVSERYRACMEVIAEKTSDR